MAGAASAYTETNLPPGLSLNSVTRTITGTIANLAANDTPYLVTVTASDGTNSDRASFTWTVTYFSLVNPGDQNDSPGRSLSACPSAVRPPIALALTWSAAGLPGGLSMDAASKVHHRDHSQHGRPDRSL